AERGALSQYCLKTDAPYYFLEDHFTGEFLALDEASQLCGASLGVRAGDLFLDTCSAPGSKSYVAAMSMNNTGRIVSSDLHSSKLSLIVSGADRLGIKIIETREADARDFFPDFERAFDCVLCDVPCSGLGVIGGKPEIKYKNVKELSALPDIQYAILSTSSRYVKAGGTLVYSTCTVLPEENELNVQKFLSANSEFSLEPFRVGNGTCDGMITLTPDVHGTDGFFIAKLKRKS
ncbi:MAG: 16S rRNA (cytosine(967)-C(5))-methyltransferase RsmB, partial [Clostridia bacterium]|nr:16S rRNA (cytosine(967)-C(5))-methyltransferase RsmB [Clostridia bacterium]